MFAVAVFGFGAGVGGVEQPALVDAAVEREFPAVGAGVVGRAVILFAAGMLAGFDGQLALAGLEQGCGGIEPAAEPIRQPPKQAVFFR